MRERKKNFMMKFSAFVLAFAMVATALPLTGLVANAADTDTVSVWRSYNPNSGEHMLGIKAEVEALTYQGWSWDNNGEPVLYGVKDGEIIEAAKLIDESGLQSDGTALTTDTLRVTYTENLGNPAQVVWYKDGTAVKSETAATTTFTLQPGTGKDGNYFAVITNTKGETFKSNTLVVTDVAAPAVVSNFALSQDYTYGVTDESGALAIDYATTTDGLVATFELNKEYAGVPNCDIAADLVVYGKEAVKLTSAVAEPASDAAATWTVTLN